MDNPLQPSIQSLKSISLLSSFTEPELEKILSFGREIQYDAHTNMVIEGELSWGLYILVDGTVGIYKTNPLNGQNYDVGHLRPGATFGEMSLVDENPRSATVRALTKTTAYYISKDSFIDFISSSNELEHKFLSGCVKVLATMLRELNDKYVISQYQLWEAALRRKEEA